MVIDERGTRLTERRLDSTSEGKGAEQWLALCPSFFCAVSFLRQRNRSPLLITSSLNESSPTPTHDGYQGKGTFGYGEISCFYLDVGIRTLVLSQSVSKGRRALFSEILHHLCTNTKEVLQGRRTSGKKQRIYEGRELSKTSAQPLGQARITLQCLVYIRCTAIDV